MPRRKAKYTTPVKRPNLMSAPYWSFWVHHPQGSYKRMFTTRKEARRERWSLEKILGRKK